jgi:hypothetical protein
VTGKGGRTEIELDFDQSVSYDGVERSYKGAGWILFAAIMLLMGAALSIIWGIAAVSNSHFFVAGAAYIVSDLNTWGWIVMGFGALDLALDAAHAAKEDCGRRSPGGASR